MRILNEAQVRQCLPISVAIQANRKALGSIRSDKTGGSFVPTRLSLPYFDTTISQNTTSSTCTANPADFTLIKPAAYYPPSLTNMHSIDQISSKNSYIKNQKGTNDENNNDVVIMGMKCVSIRANNPSLGLSTVPATILLIDAKTGQVNAVIAATYLTAMRTAAGSAIATELILQNNVDENNYQNDNNDKPSLHLVLFGAGLQAEMHVKTIHSLNPLSKITIVNRTKKRADDLKQRLLNEQSSKTHNLNEYSIETLILNQNMNDIEQAVRSANIIVTATNTSTPLFPGRWISPHCHINGVGSYTPDMKELDEALIDRSRILLDTPEALDVGDLKHLKNKMQHDSKSKKENIMGLLGDYISGHELMVAKGPDHLDCTVFKSVGTAIQDILTATEVLKRAEELGLGSEIHMG